MPKEYLNPNELFPSLQYGFSQIVVSSEGKTVHRWPGMNSNRELGLMICERKPINLSSIITALCHCEAHFAEAISNLEVIIAQKPEIPSLRSE